MLILGCMACIGDCVLRMTACDRPSKFALHYAGNVDGPVKAFGFDMGYYAMESETACFTEPELTTTRTQLLDYFYQQRKNLQVCVPYSQPAHSPTSWRTLPARNF